jgi:predicted small lipoprotein YifL
MMRRIFATIALSLVLASCGVKTDLVMPNGNDTPKDQNDPSKPTHPLGR